MPSVHAIRGGRAARVALAVPALAACLVWSSCGGDGNSDTGLSKERAANLRATLSEVESRVDSKDCSGAAQRASAFRQEVEQLPSRVEADLRDALDGSAARLEALVAEQCSPTSETEQPPATETTPSDGNATDQQQSNGKGKKPKKPKKPKDEQPPDTGVTGPTGATGTTGATGPDGGASIPEGGG